MNPNESIAALVGSITAELGLVIPALPRVLADCGRLRALLSRPASPRDVEGLRGLLSALARSADPAAEPVAALLLETAESCTDPRILLEGLLLARDGSTVLRALDLAARRAEAGTLAIERSLVRCVAERVDRDESLSGDRAVLAAAGRVLRRGRGAGVDGEDPAAGLYRSERPGPVRRLAARVLDLMGEPVPAERAALVLGSEAHAALDPYLRYTRATHIDLLHLAPGSGLPAGALADLRRAEAACGEEALRQILAALGWARVNLGIEVRPRIAVRVGASLPLWVDPSEVPLLESHPDARRVGEAFLVLARGGAAPDGETAPAPGDPVLRFRGYNLAHAEALAEILAMAPLTARRVEHLLGLMDRLVEDFIALFTPLTQECAILPGVYGELKAGILAELARRPAGPGLTAELTRRVQMFEDPGSLGEVRTLHGLKRYLHQQGLRLGLRLVTGGRATDRSVSIALASRVRLLRILPRIDYAELDIGNGDGPGAVEGGPALPGPVGSIADAFCLALLHGQERFPDAKVFCYGNEVHYYLSYGNHPAFLRVDTAPPLQGGMIDLEYYGVSKYVQGEHPDPSLQAVGTFLERLDFDVRIRNTRVTARYDKDRTLEAEELHRAIEALLRLTPHLMDLDWTIGDLDLPDEAKRAVAEAWADRFAHWGVIPMKQVLAADGRGIRLPGDAGAAAERAWTGAEPYRDRFAPVPESFLRGLEQSFAALGLDRPPLAEADACAFGQLDLERLVLRPLRDAVARGELLATPSGLRRETPDRFQRTHEAERFASILDGSWDALAGAARVARVAGPIERSLSFRTTGSVNGFEVQRAALPLSGGRIGVYVLRDATGLARLAFFAPGEALWRAREGKGEPWRLNGSVDAARMLLLLRRNSYLPPGAAPAPEDPPAELERLRDSLRRPLRSAPPPAPGERVVPGVRVSPGRAAGRARFGTAGRAPGDLDGAILVTAEVRPEDAPFLYRATGVVATGGSTLSHAALLAAQFHKPGLLIAGSWRREADGSESLGYRVLEYTEEERTLHDARVIVRRGVREREWSLREGDLVVLDAGAGVLRVLGQDRDALALSEELRQLGDTRRGLAAADGDRELLALRGRRLRAVHQMRKLLDRLTDPALARYAAQEILLGEAMEGETAGRKAELLLSLLGNPAAAAAAREHLRRTAADLALRAGGALDRAARAAPVSDSLYEVLAVRLDALRLRAGLKGAWEALRSCGLDLAASGSPPSVDLDAVVRGRLARLRGRGIRSVRAAGPGDARLRHAIRQIERIDLVLGAPAPGREPWLAVKAGLAARDTAAQRRLGDRRVLDRRECGFELFSEIGWKAANLAEVERLTEPARVPEWFAVTHRAFEEMLAAFVPRDGVGDGPSGATVGSAVDAILARRDLDAFQQSTRIRAIWERAEMPPALAREVIEAYRRLGPGGPAGPNGAADGPYVAVRSSAREEDTETAARAGEFDTFLFVRGDPSLLLHLRRAWSGLWSARAIQSRALFGSDPAPVGGGVVVQRIVDARASGVIQTINVSEGTPSQMVVNAGLGLGEGVVSGSVAADLVVVEKQGDPVSGALRFRYVTADKRERVVFDRRTGSGTVRTECLYHQRLRPALEYTELSELVAVAQRLEAAYGYPLDIEFALEGDRLWILQARPVATFRTALRETLERHPISRPPRRGAPVRVEEAGP